MGGGAVPRTPSGEGRLPEAPLSVLQINHAVEWRGAERQTFLLARELARRGHRSLIAAHPDGALAAQARDAGLEVFTWPSRFGRRWTRIMWWIRDLVLAQHLDIAHAQTARAVMFGVAATLGTGTRLVVTRHVLPPLPRNPGTWWKYRRPAAIIAVSRAVAGVLAEGGVPRSRIVVIPTGVESERRWGTAPPARLAELGVQPGQPLVVMAGALDQAKDPETFVRAVAAARREVGRLQALLLGEGPLRPEVERLVRELGLDGVLHLPGHVTDATELLAAADIVAASSRLDALPTVLIDALVLGKPVVATRAGGIPEIIEHDRTGVLVPVGDAGALGAAIARLLREPESSQRLATAARADASRFSVDALGRRTEALYRRLLAGEPLHDLA